MVNKINKITLALKDLSLWDENARFPDKYFNKTESELISYFCSKKEFKILELAEEMVNEFELPQLEKLVVYNINDLNIVIEGNRRLAIYKLLDNPELAENPVIRKKFAELKLRIKIDNNFSLECLSTDDIEQGFVYIERKHLKGNNEATWKDNERAHHKARRGKAGQKELFKVGITKIVKNLNIPEEMKEQVLGVGYVTNFWRILESSPAWVEFGYKIDGAGSLKVEDGEFENKLKVIILNVLQKKDFNGNKIDSRSLNTNKEKEVYLKSIADSNYEKVESEIEKNTTTNLFNESGTDVTVQKKQVTRSNPKTSSRNTLIPNTCVLIIGSIKINNIYHELKRTPIDKSPNAIGVLFRVFLEIGLDFYAEKNGFEFSISNNITEKIARVTKGLEDKGLATVKQLKNIRSVASDKSSILHVENFHRYVHCLKMEPTPDGLKYTWNNLQEFFEILWKCLQVKK